MDPSKIAGERIPHASLFERVIGPVQRLHRSWTLAELSPAQQTRLIQGQIDATRPIISAVIFSGAVILAITGVFEVIGEAPGIGYPWWLIELVALAVAASALAIWHIADWRPRLALTLLSTVLVGVFLSIPMPGMNGQLAIRTGLFQLLPIALLALMVRPVSIVSLVAVMLLVAWVRVRLHGVPQTGAALYWMYTWTTIGFGLMMGGYRTQFAVSAFHLRSRMREQALTDALTGLQNRAGWNRYAVEAYAAAIAVGLPTSFAFLDIDLFKKVNDTHGHEAGDEVLRMLGRILCERADPGSVCARLGGEEFVVLFVDQTPDQIEGYLRRVRIEFEAAASAYDSRVSAGVAHRQPGEAMGAHLRRADLALYQAKAQGRDRIVVSAG